MSKMSCFPLYDNLISSEKKRALTKDERRALVQKIGALDQDGNHKILALVLYYQYCHDIKPYLEPSVTVKINLNSLPAELQVILDLFCTMHLQYMKEDLNRTHT